VEPGRVAAIAAAMLSALGAVHGAGIVHRDVKPGNIMLAEDGQILLTDFGIAKGGGDETVTSTGGFLGSLEYTAPERAEGAAGDLSSDLFSLGVTLFHAVEGSAPFHRETKTGILTAILLKPLPPMTRATGTLHTVIRALTMKNPADRPTIAQAQELLSGTRTLWEPLARAETIESATAAETQKVQRAAGPKPPWEQSSATSTNNVPRPALLQAPTLDEPARRDAGRKRNLVIALTAVAVMAVAATAIVLSSGGSGQKGSATAQQGLAANVGTSSTGEAGNGLAGQGQAPGQDPSSSSAQPSLSPSLQSLVSTLATLPGSAGPGPGSANAPGAQKTTQAPQTTTQAPPATTTHTTTTPPAVTTTTTTPPKKTTVSEQAGASGAATFTNYHNASGVGSRLAAAQWVEVTCKVLDTTIPSVDPDGYWYRIASSPWNNAYYAPANSFKNGDPWTGTITNPHNTDYSVPNC
jgi:serine/threonine protein kinase